MYRAVQGDYHTNEAERGCIVALHHEGWSIEDIARKLNRNVSINFS